MLFRSCRIRATLKEKLKLASVSKIGIERAGKYLRVNIYTARPGIVIGKGGQGIETLRKEVEAMTSRKTFVNVMEIKRPEVNTQLNLKNEAPDWAQIIPSLPRKISALVDENRQQEMRDAYIHLVKVQQRQSMWLGVIAIVLLLILLFD